MIAGGGTTVFLAAASGAGVLRLPLGLDANVFGLGLAAVTYAWLAFRSPGPVRAG